MMKEWLNQFLDSTILFSFDRSGFKRHCKTQLETVDLSGRSAIVTGASSGIGLAVAKQLLKEGCSSLLIARDLQKIEKNIHLDAILSLPNCFSLDMSHLKEVYSFAINQVKQPIDILVHNAGSMPLDLKITEEGYEEMFASQVLAPFIFTKTLAALGKLNPGCRIIFVSSGGMYLQKLDLSDLSFEKKSYNKYTGYANAKRAQVVLSNLFAKHYPDYLFSVMHPGWVDTPGVSSSMPWFKKFLGKRLRTSEEGADTILWLATTSDYPNGRFWLDRKEVKTTFCNLYRPTEEEENNLWSYCQSVLDSIKG